MASQTGFTNVADADSPLDIVPYSGRIGAIARNIRLDAGLDDATFVALRKALARATEHCAINDYGDRHRVVRRVTIAGDVPVSVDGRRSQVLKPDRACHAQAAE